MKNVREVSMQRIKAQAAILATAACCLTGCGIGRVTYPSPRVEAIPAPTYLYWLRPTDGGRDQSSSPTGVDFEIDGLRIALFWSSRVAYPTPANSAGPLCTRDKVVLLIPPIPWIFTTDRGTDHIEMELVLKGEGALFDPAQVILKASNGKEFKVFYSVDDKYPGPGRAWILGFDAPCIPDGAYEVQLNGISRDGKAVAVPPVRFTPASDWYSGGP